MKTSNKTISPWFWVPTLYFAEGVPYFVVNNISVMMFTKMGVPNGDMAFFTTLLYFPWFLKGLWGPLVDVVKTKRWWILSMQVLMTALMILLTVTLPKPDVATDCHTDHDWVRRLCDGKINECEAWQRHTGCHRPKGFFQTHLRCKHAADNTSGKQRDDTECAIDKTHKLCGQAKTSLSC